MTVRFGQIKQVLGPYGKPVPGGVAEKVHVEINGVRQGMVIRGADPTHPVLLFVSRTIRVSPRRP